MSVLQGEAQRLRAVLQTQQRDLDRIRQYWRGTQEPPTVVPKNVPDQVRQILRTSRVNVIRLVIDSVGQSLFMDGFRAGNGRDEQDVRVWDVWQRNRFDRRQSGVYRSAVAYGRAWTDRKSVV